jgi:O-antigen/teichoic acid export membrane protein
MRKKVVSLFAANTFSYLMVGLSFVVYSRVLSPGEFGAYGAALAAATMLSLVLDGGIKTTIIKMQREVTDTEEAVALWLMLLGALLITTLFYGLQRPLLLWWPQIRHDYRFVVSFLGVSLFFYPLVTLPTAWLEHRLSYGHIAWIESTGMLLERGAPALILLWFHSGVYSFLWALVLSRIFRAVALSKFHRCALRIASFRELKQGVHLLGEGGWIQLATLSNVARDNLHVLLVGPFFGMAWIGNYTWALQVCQISSQAFAQISARVALPLFAQGGSFEDRWTQCLLQIRLLMVLTGPVLCSVWLMLPSLNARLFHGKWTAALVLIPLLFLRMLPGLATTPLSPLIMVHCGGRAYARVAFLWTLAEIAGAVLCIALLGAIGLAWSYAFMVWVGVWLMLAALGPSEHSLVKQLARQIFRRPSLYFAGAAVLLLTLLFKNINPVYSTSVWFFGLLAGIVVSVSYLLEPDIRAFLKYGKT